MVVPECDVFVHAGDITDRGEDKTIRDFFDWLEEIKAKIKIVIGGNHDFWFTKQRDPSVYTGRPGIHYLEHQELIINGVKFFGSPWTPYFYDWAFNGTDEETGDSYGPNLNRLFGQIPDDTDVLISHGPSAGILSTNLKGEDCGSKMLFKHLIRVRPKVHIHGHIHESYGSKIIDWPGMDTTRVYNVSGLKRDYITPNPVTVIDL